MKVSLIITHIIAITLGWMLMSFSDTPEASTPNEKKTAPSYKKSSSHSFNRQSRQSHAQPSILLAILADTSMEPDLRTTMKNNIYRNWANSDPIGLLEYLQDRAWPGYYFNAPFDSLAQSQPDYLFDYAKQHGCISALEALAADRLISNTDPRIILETYLKQNPNTIPADHYKQLFDRGSRIDPKFHLNIVRINDPAAREAAFKGSTKALFELKRLPIYFALFERLHESLPLKSITNDFADHLVSQKEDANLISSLPEKARALAAGYMIDYMTHLDPRADNNHRGALAIIINNGWIDNHIENAQHLIEVHSYSPDESQFPQAVAWKNWALKLPDGEKLKPLRETALRGWMVSEPSQWKEIADLPNPELRDVAYTALLHSIDLENEAENIPWITRQITNPEYQKIAARVLELRRDGDDDPFGPSINPFNPFDPENDSSDSDDPFKE